MSDPQHTPKFNAQAFGLSTLFLAMTWIGVAMGLMTSFPAIGWPLGIVSIPVFFRTVKIVQHRQAVGVIVTSLDKVKVFLRTLAVVSALVAIWCVSGVTCLIGFCGTASSLSSRTNGQALVLFILLVLGALGVWVSMRLNKKYEDRYQQDVGSDLRVKDLSPSGYEMVEQERTEDAEL